MSRIKAAIEDFHPDPRLLDERGATVHRYRRAEQAFDISDTGKTTMRDSPIERALARKMITPSQYNAATKFYSHWFRAGLAGNLGSADLNRVFGGDNNFSGMPRNEVEAFHRQRFRQAVNMVGDSGSKALIRVICLEMKFEEVGRQLGWNNIAQATASAIQVTRDALDILAREWGTA